MPFLYLLHSSPLNHEGTFIRGKIIRPHNARAQFFMFGTIMQVDKGQVNNRMAPEGEFVQESRACFRALSAKEWHFLVETCHSDEFFLCCWNVLLEPGSYSSFLNGRDWRIYTCRELECLVLRQNNIKQKDILLIMNNKPRTGRC